jgi:hypothetical protein
MAAVGDEGASATVAVPTGAGGTGERGGPALREGEISYSFADMVTRRRRSLPWEIAATLACAAGGAALGHVAVPAFLHNTTSVGARAEFGGVVVLSILAISGALICCVQARPLPVYGPQPAPKPRPLWLALLRLLGCWLLTLPFSAICLLAVGFGVDAAVNGGWGQAAIRLAVGIAFGAGGAVLIAGSGIAAGTGLRPGGEVPSAVRRSPWWRRVLWMLALWAMLMTGFAVSSGIQGQWGDFADTLVTALGSWLALAIAANGKLPDDTFSS